MARIRSLKAEYFDDEDVGRVSRDARLLFLGMWPQADREGRLEDRPARLKVRIFPYDEDVDGARVNGLLDELQAAGFILRYERDGERVIQIRSFVKHQRPHPHEPASMLPAPESREKTRRAVEKHDEKLHSCHPPYQETRDKRPDPEPQIPDPEPPEPDRFAVFWDAYPRHVGKQAAERAFEKLHVSDALLEILLAAIGQQKRTPEWLKNRGQFIPHPATWLNGHRWDDEVEVDPAVAHALGPNAGGHWHDHCQHQPKCDTLPQHQLRLAREQAA